MMPAANPRFRLLAAFKRVWTDDCASQIVEFALSLPLLVVFVVGIFDFSGAVSLKQKLTNAAREGARVAAADPANDVGATSSGVPPASVADAFYVVDNYLISEKIADCGLSFAIPTQTPTTLTWTSTATTSPCGFSGALILTINRGWVTQQTIDGATVNVVSTRVTLQYPYNWQYGKFAGLVGGRFIGPASLSATATAFNEN
jgi:Flp pilus assembly protein TadG